MEIKITSTAFEDGGNIPEKFTCDGANISPHLAWEVNNKDIKTFALIVDDPDASSGDWVHWVIYNIPGNYRELHEDTKANRNLPDNATMGINDFHKIEYGGPCPPSGTHNYHFKIYALNTILHMGAGATKKEIMDAIKGHIIDQGELVGRYTKKR